MVNAAWLPKHRIIVWPQLIHRTILMTVCIIYACWELQMRANESRFAHKRPEIPLAEHRRCSANLSQRETQVKMPQSPPVSKTSQLPCHREIRRERTKSTALCRNSLSWFLTVTQNKISTPKVRELDCEFRAQARAAWITFRLDHRVHPTCCLSLTAGLFVPFRPTRSLSSPLWTRDNGASD